MIRPKLSSRSRLMQWALVACCSVFGACDKSSNLGPTGPTPPSCLDRAVFGDPAGSPYILPFRVGFSHTLLQSYCNQNNSHYNQLAYDIRMPIGEDVVAVAGGIVRDIKEDWPDDGISSQNHNFVSVEHFDGTVAFYAHLMQNGVYVEIGETVAQGQLLAASGTSAVPFPLTHFGIYQSWPPREGYDLAVNFNNLEGELDERGGLKVGETYTALPY